jgi:HNH endonuclease
MQKSLEEEVWRRAGGRCEYCHLPWAFHPTPFQIDHIIAEQHGGLTVSDNLAIACLRCNKRKGPNLSGVSAETGEIVRLFHPRKDNWADHFRWDGALLVGRTPIGMATIAVLAINHPTAVAVREALIAVGVVPA